MAENYSLNNGFGLNVQKNNIKPSEAKNKVKSLDETVGDLFDNITGYVAKYENVFNGEVEKETNMYIRQSMMVGMNLRAEDKRKPNFDMNI